MAAASLEDQPMRSALPSSSALPQVDGSDGAQVCSKAAVECMQGFADVAAVLSQASAGCAVLFKADGAGSPFAAWPHMRASSHPGAHRVHVGCLPTPCMRHGLPESDAAVAIGAVLRSTVLHWY